MSIKTIKLALFLATFLGLIGFGLFSAQKAHAAITLDTQVNGAIGGSSWTINTLTVSAGASILVAHIELRDFSNGSPSYTSVTWNGVALTLLTNKISGEGAANVAIYYLVNPASGNRSLVITGAAITDEVHVTASSWFGVNTITPFRASNSANASGTAPSVAVTSAANDVVVDCVGGNAANTTAMGGGQTALRPFGGVNASSYKVASGTSTTMSWTTGSENWAIVAGSMQPALASVTTTAATSLDTTKATLNGTADPLSFGAVTGYFRYATGATLACDDVTGTRFPSNGGSSIANGTGAVAFSQTLTGISAGTQYAYCAYGSNANGVGKAASSQTFTTPTNTAGCAPPVAGSFQITSSCYFPNQYDGVDLGGTTATTLNNTGTLTLPAGSTLTVGPGAVPNQKIAYGSIVKPGAVIVKFSGSQLIKGGVWAPDADGDGVPDSANPVYTIASTRPAGYSRRSFVGATNITVADCSPSNANIYQNVATLVADVDNDGYKTSAAAATQCVGTSSTINGRTYYKDASNNSTWLPSASALGSGATDCNDASTAPCAPTGGSATAASATQMNVSWSAGVGPAQTSYNLVWCSGASCTPGTTITGVTSTYAHTGRTCGTIYGYNIIPVNASGSGPASSTFYGTSSSCASAPSVTTNAASSIGYTVATLNGTFNANGGTSNTYSWRYGTTNTGNCSTLTTPVAGGTWGSGSVSIGTSVAFSGGTTYYFCALATNNIGTTYGSILSFTTLTQKANGSACTTNDECVSGNCYVDADGDRYAPAAGSKTCKASAQIAGTDCYDGNASAYPGSPSSSTASRGDGSFDFNCDGLQTPDSVFTPWYGTDSFCSMQYTGTFYYIYINGQCWNYNAGQGGAYMMCDGGGTHPPNCGQNAGSAMYSDSGCTTFDTFQPSSPPGIVFRYITSCH